MAVSEILKVKAGDFTKLIQEASIKIGLSPSAFMRMSAIRVAKETLSEDKK